jgi:predicted small metal-binding protein
MKRFSCGDVVPGCTATFESATEGEILQHVAAHAMHDHGMTEIPEGVVAAVRSKIIDEAN